MNNKTLLKILLIGLFALFVFGKIASQKVFAMNYVETTIYNIGYSGGDIVVDGSGNIFIVDDYNYLVKKYNVNGVFQTSFGGNGTGNGKFTGVFGIALDTSGNIFVVDTSRVQKFSNAGVYQSQFAVSGTPLGIALDSSNNIYVTRSSAGTSLVSKYNSAGTFLQSYGSYGTGNTQLRCPSNIKVDSAGTMYVSDNGNARVQVWDNTGAFLYSLTGFGPGILGNCDYPVDIDTNVSGDVFVADTYNNIVNIYSSTGDPIGNFAVEGNPYGLNVQSPVILVTSAGDTSLRRFTLDDGVPTVSITPFASNKSYTAHPTITGIAQDVMSPIWSVEYMLDSNPGVWLPCVASDGAYDETNEPYSCVVSPALVPYDYTVSVRATDNVLNVNSGASIATYSFTVEDNAPPVVAISPLAGNQTYGNALSFNGSAIDAVTAVTTVEYEIASNPGVWTLCTAQDGGFNELSETYTCAVTNPLNLGAQTINVRATDSVAHTNTGGSIASYSFTIVSTVAPTVTTGAVTGISTTAATIAGNVTSDGGQTISERGLVYSSVVTVPTTSDLYVILSGTTGAMSTSISSLTSSTHYYVRAFARNVHGISYGNVVEFTTLTPTPTPSPTVTVPASLVNLYVTFGKFKYNKYISPSALRAGDTAYIKNFNSSKTKLLQVFLYDYAKKGNQGYAKSKVTSTSMFLKTLSTLPTGKRYAYVFKFQDKATGIIVSKYFTFYTTKTWMGKSVLGAKTTNDTVVEEDRVQILPTDSLPPTTSSQPSGSVNPSIEPKWSEEGSVYRTEINKQNVVIFMVLTVAVLGTLAFVITRKRPE